METPHTCCGVEGMGCCVQSRMAELEAKCLSYSLALQRADHQQASDKGMIASLSQSCSKLRAEVGLHFPTSSAERKSHVPSCLGIKLHFLSPAAYIPSCMISHDALVLNPEERPVTSCAVSTATSDAESFQVRFEELHSGSG